MFIVVLMGTLWFPARIYADDLAQALTFAESVMGEEVVVGYEAWMDWDETEALPIFVGSEDVVPYAPAGALRTGDAGVRP